MGRFGPTESRWPFPHMKVWYRSKTGHTHRREYETHVVNHLELSAATLDSVQKQSVLHIGKFYRPHLGGIETHVEALCQGLRKSMDVRVLVASNRRWGEECVIDGVPVTRVHVPISVAGAPICPGMLWHIRKNRPDIIHLHLPNPTGVLAVLASGYRGPVVVTWHSDIVRQRRLARLYQPIERLLLRQCAAIVASSPAYIASSPVLREHADRCRSIPFGIDAEKFDDRHVDQSLVRELRQRFGSRMILSVGRLVYYKGIQFLIQAMEKVDAKLVIIGEGPMRPALEQEVAARGIADRVTFLGRINDHLPTYFHAAEVFALPSCERSEAFGIVQLEAMASGKPVINTQIDSGVPYVSLDGITGITVQPRSSDAMAAALNRLFDDPELRRRMGHAGRHRVQKEFNLELMVRRTLDIYEEVGGRAIDPLFESNGAARAEFSSHAALR
jgi:glycosyltransferase involved in cell wall biosynthesis